MGHPDRGEIDAITVATLYGGENPYTRHLINESEVNGVPIAGGYVQDNPRIYTWIELTVGADGTRIVRVPDTSVFPKHLGYINKQNKPKGTANVNGRLEGESGLEIIYDTEAESSDDWDVAVNEKSNNVWDTFKNEVEMTKTPYGSIHLFYYAGYSYNAFEHPVMLYGVDANGNSLSESECHTRLTNELPQSPFPALLGISSLIE